MLDTRSKVVGAVIAAIALVVGIPSGGPACASHSERLQRLIGATVDVGLSKDSDVLWGVGARNVVLRALAGDRAVFEDPSGRFAAANAERLSDEDRFHYGPETMAKRPLVLSPTSFSVLRDEIAYLRVSGEVVWIHPDHAFYVEALKRARYL